MNDDIVSFPEHLIEEFAYKRAVPFIGAGLSATAKKDNGQSLITWDRFIECSKRIMHSSMHEKMIVVDKLVSSGDQLQALQVVRNYSDPGDYQKLIKDTFTAKGYKPSSAHEALRDLDSKITITTNFDNIYENFCRSINFANMNAYSVINYDNEEAIIENIRSSENVIIKAHGSVVSPNNIIFTQFDYLRAQREHPNFYSILTSIFLLNTVLFIGYGINDPDINLLLSNELNTLAIGSPNYVLLPEGTYTTEDATNWKENYNVIIISYKRASDSNIYGNFSLVIEQFVEEVEALQNQRGITPGVTRISSK
ncbi:hypothetical protein EFO81_04355 [Lactiplantibacillus plantarum]|uniref:SIR2 family protein n=1 Tax=Lactiplantibacillus plantarum TaxID=1590 RepID=UPI0021A79826|nr:SIR2 family protein [Lactiplantibacillus plantarum]MCT3221920.1 hypothetical protein [Lactiplantibacillus plantarum]